MKVSSFLIFGGSFRMGRGGWEGFWGWLFLVVFGSVNYRRIFWLNVIRRY